MKEPLFANTTPAVQKLRAQAKRELRLKARREFKEKQRFNSNRSPTGLV